MNTLSAQQQCPLCGEANLCSVARDPKAKHCWCMAIDIPKHLIAQANQQSDPAYCICQTCAERAQSLSTEI